MTLSGRAVYEHDYGYPQHDHLYCQICDKLIEFSSEELPTSATPWPASTTSASPATA